MFNDRFPWTVAGTSVLDVSGELVCSACSKEAAQLIAQAPAMARLLKEISEADSEDCDCDEWPCRHARSSRFDGEIAAVLQKSEGLR